MQEEDAEWVVVMEDFDDKIKLMRAAVKSVTDCANKFTELDDGTVSCGAAAMFLGEVNYCMANAEMYLAMLRDHLHEPSHEGHRQDRRAATLIDTAFPDTERFDEDIGLWFPPINTL